MKSKIFTILKILKFQTYYSLLKCLDFSGHSQLLKPGSPTSFPTSCGVPCAFLIQYSPALLTPQPPPLHFPICRWLCFPNLIDDDRYIVSASPDCQRQLKSNNFLSPNNLEDFFSLKRQKKKKKGLLFNASFIP